MDQPASITPSAWQPSGTVTLLALAGYGLLAWMAIPRLRERAGVPTLSGMLLISGLTLLLVGVYMGTSHDPVRKSQSRRLKTVAGFLMATASILGLIEPIRRHPMKLYDGFSMYSSLALLADAGDPLVGALSAAYYVSSSAAHLAEPLQLAARSMLGVYYLVAFVHDGTGLP